MAEVVLDDVSKVYPNGVQAVRNLSLRVEDGELVVLVGPSGCGKTTTLRLIAGLEEPTSGTLAIGGRPVNSVPARLRDVAMVFQRPTLYPHLDVRRNLSFGLDLRRGTGWLSRLWLRVALPARYRKWLEEDQQTTQRVASAAHLLGLEGTLDRLPAQLSGGQQQRVALGRAIVRRPAVFLLDEPLSHLDGQLRVELRHELHLLQRQLRATMIYVTHDQAEAMTLADRVVVLDQGVVQQSDRPAVVYERPLNRFVASFLGWPPMNFLDGRLVQVEEGLRFEASGWTVPVPAERGAYWKSYAGRGVLLGLRPEDVEVLEPGNGAAHLSMEAVLVEALGHESLVTLQREGVQFTARLPGWARIKSQQAVGVRLQMEHAHLFDSGSGLGLHQDRLESG